MRGLIKALSARGVRAAPGDWQAHHEMRAVVLSGLCTTAGRGAGRRSAADPGVVRMYTPFSIE